MSDTTMNTEQRNALKAAALAATPGQWKWWTSNSYLRLSAKGDGDVLHGARLSDGACTVNVKPCDQAFIAAANPAAILSLIAAAESAEAAVQQPLPKWIDDQKGKDPLIDDLIAYIEGHPVRQPAQAVLSDEQIMQICRSRLGVMGDDSSIIAFVRKCFREAASHQPAAAPQPVAVPEGWKVVPEFATQEILKAMAESKAGDDEGDFPSLADLIDFSGENKTRTVLAQAYLDAVAAVPAAPSPAVPSRSSMGLPSCGKPLCSESDHHPLCSQHNAQSPAVQPAQEQGSSEAHRLLTEAIPFRLAQIERNGAAGNTHAIREACQFIVKELAAQPAVQQDAVDATLKELHEEISEMQEAAYTYGDCSKEAVCAALDGVKDAIDAAIAKREGV